MSWPGLKLNIDKNEQNIYLYVCDHRETSTGTPTNSVKTYWNYNSINLFDNNTHTLMTSWAMNDNSSILFETQDSENILNRGILVVDNVIFLGVQSWGNKRTPLNFTYDESKNSTFLALGAEFADGYSSTSLNFKNNTKNHFSGIIKDFVIWDRVLTASVFSEDYYSMNGPWEAFYNGEDPLTGENLKSFSGNVVAYYKFQEELEGSISAKDYAGSMFGGAQTNPSSGNTLSLFGSFFNYENTYTILDTSLINQDSIHFSGELQFLDENNNLRKIGKIFYEMGIIVFDNEYNDSLSGLPLLSLLSNSGMSLNYSMSGNNFLIQSINYVSSEITQKVTFNLSSSGEMMNITENPTGVNKNSGKQLLEENAGYVTGVGLYNDYNKLLAIAKLNKPIRKDSEHNININVQLEF